MAFANLPSNAKSVRPFELAVSDVELKEFKELLKHSKIPPVSWESAQVDRKYGVTHSWLTSARERWLNGFDWYTSFSHLDPRRLHSDHTHRRACEKHINSFPNFKATVIDEGQVSVHTGSTTPFTGKSELSILVKSNVYQRQEVLTA